MSNSRSRHRPTGRIPEADSLEELPPDPNINGYKVRIDSRTIVICRANNKHDAHAKAKQWQERLAADSLHHPY